MLGLAKREAATVVYVDAVCVNKKCKRRNAAVRFVSQTKIFRPIPCRGCGTLMLVHGVKEVTA